MRIQVNINKIQVHGPVSTMSTFYLIRQCLISSGGNKQVFTDVQPNSVPSFHKPGHTQEKGRLLEIRMELE